MQGATLIVELPGDPGGPSTVWTYDGSEQVPVTFSPQVFPGWTGTGELETLSIQVNVTWENLSVGGSGSQTVTVSLQVPQDPG
jgi:hypothetical protein